MLLFNTSATEHLARKIPILKGKFSIKKFRDQEVYVNIQSPVAQKSVLVLASSAPPAENLLELFFLLDALKKGGANIHLWITYFGYARQDTPHSGEASAGCLIATWIEEFPLQSVHILTMHSAKLKKHLRYENAIPLPFYTSIAKDYEMLVAPDAGATTLTEEIAKLTHLPMTHVKKIRMKNETVKIIEVVGEVEGKKILIIEDMICTGNTVIETSKALIKKGAKSVSVAATHGLFSKDALAKLQKSSIKKIYITNSLLQKKRVAKLKICDIAPYIMEKLKKI